jgi:hypothetical protein
MTTYPIGVPPRVELVIFSIPSETVVIIDLNPSMIESMSLVSQIVFG